MKRLVGSLAFVLAGAFVLVAVPPAAHAGTCSSADAATVGQLMRAMSDAFVARKYTEAEAAYQQALKLNPACVGSGYHAFAGDVARKLGDIHNALARYTMAGATNAIAAVNRDYGVVRINASSTAPTPRTLLFDGASPTLDAETVAVVGRTAAAVAGPNRVVGYLPPGRYVIWGGPHGQTRLLSFEVKAGETLMLSYP